MKDRIEYIDLLYSIYSSLKTEYPDKSKVDITFKKKNQEVNKPRFYIEIRPLNSDSYRQYDRELVNVTITYTDVVLDQEKTLTMQNTFNVMFDQGIWVEGVFLYFEKKGFSEGEECINFNFTLNYFNAKAERNIPINDKYTEMMKELDIDFNDKEEVIN